LSAVLVPRTEDSAPVTPVENLLPRKRTVPVDRDIAVGSQSGLWAFDVLLELVPARDVTDGVCAGRPAVRCAAPDPTPTPRTSQGSDDVLLGTTTARMTGSSTRFAHAQHRRALAPTAIPDAFPHTRGFGP